jgi:hypothetical protein
MLQLSDAFHTRKSPCLVGMLVGFSPFHCPPEPNSFTLKMEAAPCCTKSMSWYDPTRCNNPQNYHLMSKIFVCGQYSDVICFV